MALHVVGFTNITRFEGNTPVFLGRELVSEYSDTKAFKALKPGDREIPWPSRPQVVYDFVAADHFGADLYMAHDYAFGSQYVTLHDKKTNTYYPMFYGDFAAMAEKAIIVRGRITGKFGYVKKNKNFGITYQGEL